MNFWIFESIIRFNLILKISFDLAMKQLSGFEKL